EEELKRLRERHARVETAPADEVQAVNDRDRVRRELDAVTGQIEAARTDWVRDLQEATTKRDAYRVQYKEIEEQRERLADLGPESPCPICTRPLADHFREVLDDLDGKLTAIRVDGKYFATRVEQLEETPAPLKELETRARQLNEELERHSKALSDIQLRV